jgi:hypothetical protein
MTNAKPDIKQAREMIGEGPFKRDYPEETTMLASLADEVERLEHDASLVPRYERELVALAKERDIIWKPLLEKGEKLKEAYDEIVGVEHQDCSRPPCSGCAMDDSSDEFDEQLRAAREEMGK